MNIRNNINKFKQILPPHCQLIAVSKTQSVEKIREAYEAGQRAFGENKVQELMSKYAELPTDIQWHLIGHLQTNKVKYIAPFIHLIHSVDSFKLLVEINKQGARNARRISCLLQVHISQEETKFGFTPEEVLQLVATPDIYQLENIAIAGLMGMASFTEDKAQVRKEFRGLKNLFDQLVSMSLPSLQEMKILSMGMSGDFETAIEEGSTMVRIGSALFGERKM